MATRTCRLCRPTMATIRPQWPTTPQNRRSTSPTRFVPGRPGVAPAARGGAGGGQGGVRRGRSRRGRAGCRFSRYSLVGVRPDADFLVWKLTERYEDLRDLAADLNGTPLAGLARRRRTRTSPQLARRSTSSATRKRPPRRIVPREAPYLVVYPFVKVRPWYALSMEDRRRAMQEHAEIGSRFVDDHEPHDVLVRDRRPGVHDGLRVRGARSTSST